MNMMQMVAFMVICYFITLTLLCVYRKIINVKIANYVFIGVDLVFFFCWNYAAHLRGWLKDGFMTLENISPFMIALRVSARRESIQLAVSTAIQPVCSCLPTMVTWPQSSLIQSL